jgi:hypothetical protein
VSWQLRLMPLTLTGRSPADKLRDLRAALAARRATGTVVTALDEVAWLYNLRGSDIPFNPVFFAYCASRTASAKRGVCAYVTLYVNVGEQAGADSVGGGGHSVGEPHRGAAVLGNA